jgi:hypothetical protein
MDIPEGAPDAASDAALWPARQYLKPDLEQVERVHAEHGDCARANTGERVVLQSKSRGACPCQQEQQQSWAEMSKKAG